MTVPPGGSASQRQPQRLARNGGFPTKRTLQMQGLPYNRENYIRLNWGRDIPDEEWTSEDEMELPPELREGFDD